MTPTSEHLADRPAEPALFAHLVDDAAVFPPGSAPLDEAVLLHRAYRGRPYAGLVGPLLVPAGESARIGLLATQESPLRIVVIGRPGVSLAAVETAVAQLTTTAGIELAGVELPWAPEWRAADLGGLPLTLEVPRGRDQVEAIEDIAKDASDTVPLQAKFRTGATPTWAWPDEAELATFLRSAIDHDLGFKLTGGLHHAVRGARAGEDQHGLLNVITAVRWALNGEEVGELIPLLAERDPAVLVPQVLRMSAADAAIVRAFFTAFGCCGVTDPIGELAALGLIEGA